MSEATRKSLTRFIIEKFLREKSFEREKMTVGEMEKEYSDGLNHHSDYIIQKMENAFKKKFPFKTITVFLITLMIKN